MSGKPESMFTSFFRSFFKSFAFLLGIGFAAVALGFAFSFFSKSMLLEGVNQIVVQADDAGRRSLLPNTAPAILRINIHGAIGTPDLNAHLIQNQLLDSREGILKNNRIKAILLDIDSPGGTVQDSHDIYTALMAYKKEHGIPIYAYINGMCASGGMYIACSADKIFSNSTGLIGSIGVKTGPHFNVSKLMEKYGVSEITLTEGKGKDMLSPYRPFEEENFSSLRDVIAYYYKQFTDIVVKNRLRVDKNKLINVYGAQVYDPPKAREIGYIDESDATYFSTLKQLAKAAEIDQPYQVFELKLPYSVLSNLMKKESTLFSGKITHEFELLPGFRPEWMGRFLYFYCPALESGL